MAEKPSTEPTMRAAHRANHAQGVTPVEVVILLEVVTCDRLCARGRPSRGAVRLASRGAAPAQGSGVS
jgi:hypothetical protein